LTVLCFYFAITEQDVEKICFTAGLDERSERNGALQGMLWTIVLFLMLPWMRSSICNIPVTDIANKMLGAGL
jgi:hypothetical protein